MATGTVKTVTDKGYGFIKTPESKDKDIFYHESNLKGELATRKLRVGDEVVFKIEQNDRGLNATDIKLAGAEESEVEAPEAEQAEEVETTEEEVMEESEESEQPEEEAVA